MVATVAWLAILATAIVWAAVSHTGSGWASLTTMALRLWRNPLGRIAYVAIWAFVGWHVFARYTLPR